MRGVHCARRHLPLRPAGMLLLLLAASCHSIPAQVTPDEQSQWLNWLIPLPKQISIPQKLVLPADAVYLELSADPSARERNAAQLLADLFRRKADVDLTSGTFMIRLGLIDAQGKIDDMDFTSLARQLRRLPNAAQAYSIRPVDQATLLVAALDEQGLLHGVQTLRQLLEPAFTQTTVSIPLATVVDWPDIEQRGFWEDGFTAEQIRYLSAVKFNTINVRATLTFDQRKQPVVAKIPHARWKTPPGGEAFTTFCHINGIHCVPFILHLSHLKRTGLYDRYPELEGKGASARTRDYSSWRAPCSSHPEFAKVLAGWMVQMAGYEYIDEVQAWLTEDFVFCECDRCRKQGDYVAQTRALANAWEMARKTHPDLKLQLLLTQGSYSANDKVIAAAQRDMRIVYYDGGRTYDSSREPMIYPLLEDYTKNGGWLGVFPQMTASWALTVPWSCPQFVRARMNEFADKQLHAVIGYAAPSIDTHDFNVTAAAEWAWNARGRSEWEFTYAWATRKGIKDPQAVADWAVTLGPASWNLYGSNFPYELIWIDTGSLVDARMKPQWGMHIFRYFDDPAQLDENIRACHQAMVLALQMGNQEIIAENEVTLGYFSMLKSIAQIMTFVAENNGLSSGHHQRLTDYTGQLKQAADGTRDALLRWSRHHEVISPDQEGVKDTIRNTQTIERGVTTAVDRLVNQ